MSSLDAPPDPDSPREDLDTDDIVIHLDKFRIKVKPSKPDQPKPKSWGEVLSSINVHLMGIVSGSFAFADEFFDAARCLIRGVASIPQAYADKLKGGQEQADADEGERQAATEAGTLAPLTPDQARENLEDLIREMQAQGASVEITRLPNGAIFIAATRPDAAGLGSAMGATALPDLSDREDPAEPTPEP